MKNTPSQPPSGDKAGPSNGIDPAILRQYVFDQWLNGPSRARAPRLAFKSATAVVSPLQAPVRYLRLAQVRATTGLATSTLYRLMKHGQFPRPVQLGPNSVGWNERDIAAWCKTRKPRNRVTRS